MTGTRAAINLVHLFRLEPLCNANTSAPPFWESPFAVICPCALWFAGWAASQCMVLRGSASFPSTAHPRKTMQHCPKKKKSNKQTCVTYMASYHRLQLCNFWVNSQYKQRGKCFFRARLPVNCSLERRWVQGWCTCWLTMRSKNKQNLKPARLFWNLLRADFSSPVL